MWKPFEGSCEVIRAQFSDPLQVLASGECPALILRRAYDADHCAGLVDRFYESGLLSQPDRDPSSATLRIDIGTSFGRLRADRKAFFAHAARTHALFETLFHGFDDPVKRIYDCLQCIAPDKEVKTAREADGCLYGPAIFRIYHADIGHHPHYDSVAKRTQAFAYEISRFDHQFAGVMCFQNAQSDGRSGEPFLYNCRHESVIEKHLEARTFANYVVQEQIEKIQVKLEPGDLYFFSSENIHEVPFITGDRPRIVLAIFLAMSTADKEIFVWS